MKAKRPVLKSEQVRLPKRISPPAQVKRPALDPGRCLATLRAAGLPQAREAHSTSRSLGRLGCSSSRPTAAVWFLWLQSINPFTAPASNLLRAEKGTHARLRTAIIWWSCNKPAFDSVHFDRSPFTRSRNAGKKKSLNEFTFGHFHWSFSE